MSQGSLRFELGAWLANLLARSGRTSTDVARDMRCSLSKVSRMTSPSASRTISYSDAMLFLQAVDAPDQERREFLDMLDRLLVETRISPYRKFHTPADWARHEAVSAAPIVLHHGRSVPSYLLTSDTVDEWVFRRPGESNESFTGRKQSLVAQAQDMLTGTQSVLIILGEEVLDRASDEWLHHLMNVITRMGVYVYPYSLGHQHSMAATFTICRWPNSVIPDTVFEFTLLDPIARNSETLIQKLDLDIKVLMNQAVGGADLRSFIGQKLASRAA